MMNQTSGTAATLRKLANDYYARRNENYPVRSSEAGLHTWDNRLTDYSAGKMAERAAYVRQLLDQVRAMKTESWSKDDRIDWILFRSQLEEVEFGEISVFVSPKFVITVRQGVASELRGARGRLEQRPDLLDIGTPAVLWAILDSVVDNYAPVIAGDSSSLPEVVGDAGILVDPRDSAKIAAALADLLRDERERARRRAAGIERARLFSWEDTARRTVEVYREVGGVERET